MIVQMVQFETSLSEVDTIAKAKERLDQFRDVPGLVQKLYLKQHKPNHYCGFYIWRSREDMMAFRESDLAKSIPAAYKVVGAPDIDVLEMMFPLRETAEFAEFFDTISA